MKLRLMEGNEAIGWGAIAAGCNFFAGYPITPATTIYNTMLKLRFNSKVFEMARAVMEKIVFLS